MGVQDEKFATAHSAIPIASPNTAPTLRERAEAVALHWSITAPSNLSVEEVRRALHELQVHQIELEMQVQCLSDANDQLEITKNQLNLANARYVDLYDTAPVGYCTLDEQGVIAQANLTTCTILGVTREALVKRPITQFICKDDQDTFYLMRRELEKTRQSQSCELRLLKADGTPLWTHLAINAAEAEYTEDVIRLVISDITKRKLAQVANHTAQSRILGLVDAAMDAIISVDAKMQVVLFNQAAAKIFGVSVDEAMGGTLDRFIPARFRPMHGAQMQAFQGQGKATRNMGVPRHIVGLHSNGQEFPLEASISHLVIGGQILYTVILRDISERTRAEQALKQSDSLNASVLDSLSAHIAVLDERGVIVAVNHAWEQFGRDNGGSASTIIAVGQTT